MRKETVILKDGLLIGEVKHTEADIREVTAADLIEATIESERLVDVPGEGPHFVSSPTMVGLHTLRRQIVRVGDYKGPLSMIEMKKLSAYDLHLLQTTAMSIESASLEVAQRGRD